MPMGLRFMMQVLGDCNHHAYDINKGRMLRIAEYSRDCLIKLREKTGIQYEGRQKGLIQLFRTQAQIDHAQEDMRLLDENGVPHEFLSTQEILPHEPELEGARAPGGRVTPAG